MRGAGVLLAAAIVLAISGVGAGLGLARLAAGDAGAASGVLVLTPALVGLPLGAGLGIWGAIERGWLGRPPAETSDETSGEGAAGG